MAETPPVVLAASGAQPRSPAEILATLLARVSAIRPGYTANLPGSLIEDISSTDVAAIAECDAAMVETIDSLTPYAANDFLLIQLGNMLGVPLGVASNTSVFVTFSGLPGYVIAAGFIVSDGSHQYAVQDGGIIASDGKSAPLFALATTSGTWAVPANTVVNLVTSVPSGYTLTVTNLETGIPGAGEETAASYRGRVLQANLAASQGMMRYLKTLLTNVAGVQPRLISAQEQNGDWMIICGGGDPYSVAYAIMTALFDIADLVGSTLTAIDITAALPGVVTTDLNHLYAAGQDIVITGADPSGYNGSYTIPFVVNEKEFQLGKSFAANNITAASWATGTVTLTTNTAHGVTVGSTIVIVGMSPTDYNGTYVATSGTTGSTLKYAKVSDPGSVTVYGQLSAGISLFNSSGLGAWVSGGVITPNLRNIEVTVTDYPDGYLIPYVNPPQQTVTMTVTWNTTSPNFVSPAAIAQLATPALVTYINSIGVGQPINQLQLESAFRNAIESVLQPEYLTRLVFAVAINGIGTAVTAGTVIIEGDPQSYFFATDADISVVQG